MSDYTYNPPNRSFSEALFELCDRFGMSDFEHAAMLRAIRTKGPGRKAKYQPEFAEQARKLCSYYAATDDELGTWFGVSRRVIIRWRMDHPEFGEAVKLGKEPADDRVEQSLYTRAVGFTVDTEKVFLPANTRNPVRVKTALYHPPDVGAATLWLTNRRKKDWSTKQHVTIGGDASGEPIAIKSVPAELTERDIAYLAILF